MVATIGVHPRTKVISDYSPVHVIKIFQNPKVCWPNKPGFTTYTGMLLHPPPYKWTGEQLDGRPILKQDRTGDNFLVFLKGKPGKIPGKNWTGDKKKGGGGRARPKYRPSFYTGGV